MSEYGPRELEAFKECLELVARLFRSTIADTPDGYVVEFDGANRRILIMVENHDLDITFCDESDSEVEGIIEL
jgi:hypothetical protein